MKIDEPVVKLSGEPSESMIDESTRVITQVV